MKTLWSVIKMILFMFLLIIAELTVIGFLGFLCIRVIEMIPNVVLRYLIAILWFGGIVAIARVIGRFGLSRILDKD